MAGRIIRVHKLNPFANTATGPGRHPIDDDTTPPSSREQDTLATNALPTQGQFAPPNGLPLITTRRGSVPSKKSSTQSGSPSSSTNTLPPSLPPSPNELHSDAIKAAAKGDIGALTVILDELTPSPTVAAPASSHSDTAGTIGTVAPSTAQYALPVNTIRDEQGRTLLHVAAESAPRPLRVLAFLISKGALPCSVDTWGETPLSSVIQRGPLFLDSVRLLLKAGALPNTANDLGRTVFHELVMAWRHGPENAIAALLEHGLDVNQPSQFGVRPLFLVARHCTRPAPVVSLLLTAYPNDPERRANPNLSSISKNGRANDIDFGPPLLALARYTREPLEAMEVMIRHGASVTGSRAAMTQGLGLQGHTVRSHADMDRLLTRAAEKARAPKKSPMRTAASGSTDAAKNTKDAGKHALWTAVKNGDEVLTRQFLASTPDTFAQPNPKGETKNMFALGIAAKHRQFGVTNLIVETLPNLDVNVRDKHGMTPLLYAIASSATRVATYLLQKGAQPTLPGPLKEARLFGKDVYYDDALAYAIDLNRAPCVTAILKWNKDLQDGKAYDVNSVLAAATKRETREAVEEFIKSTKLTHGPSVAAHRLRRPGPRN